jgi:hypothetical protein
VERVSEFLLPEGGGWNEEKLRAVLFDVDVEDILKIPVGRAGTCDYLAWNYTKNGIFSVKSAYHLKTYLKRLQAGKPGTSSNCDEHKGWLSLWAADVPNKVKIHCWRLMKNGLAVGAELSRRKIKQGILCIACNREETLKHRFWECPQAKRVWELVSDLSGLPLTPLPNFLRQQSELRIWMLDWFGRLDARELEVSMMTLYHLWWARNEARDTAMIEDPRVSARRILFLAEEWKTANCAPPRSSVVRQGHWSKPDEGWHKVNADGAFPRDSDFGGGGAVLRDHHGSFVAGACYFFPLVLDGCREGGSPSMSPGSTYGKGGGGFKIGTGVGLSGGGDEASEQELGPLDPRAADRRRQGSARWFR